MTAIRMDKLKYSFGLRGLTSLLCLLIVCMIPGVYAIWIYADADAAPNPVQVDMYPELGLFLYKSEEVLPNDVPREHHNDLISSILINTKGGLNSSKDTLEKTLKNDPDGIVYGQQNVTGGNLDLVTKESSDLNFVCHMKGNNIYCYTYALSTVNTGTPGVSKIEVYLTLFDMVSESKWQIVGSQRGSAIVIDVNIDGGFRSIDITTWAPTQS